MKRIRLTESDLHRIIKESVRMVLSEGVGVFEVYTNDYNREAPIFVRVGEEFYEVPEELKYMLRGLGTKDGRMEFMDAITGGELSPCDVDVLELRDRGYSSRSFNANAF